ncbi:MAG: aminoglycoside phosphotransferase family protein [candidate division KSB1 bacterium]|nr:aminoglycoside phosphotransferase family protein [candidate division KSB1 bacterium]MDZ7302281.1 aminoglycoside phosphotransferase family protein [candidate division KSB1 bacterium]MDZ7311387.1 aminoglycoside phosphotransferase family protein [candidate division KSB1 bacterium]
MSAPVHAGGVGQKFCELYRRLSRHQANTLLNDCIYELSAAWKFLTALTPELPILVVLHGFSGAPFAFARHLCRVDILGFNQGEIDLFRELAGFKNLTNYRLCQSLEDLQGPYGLIVWLPTRSAVNVRNEDEWLFHAITHLHQRGELWVTFCYKPDWTSPLNRLHRIMRRLKSHDYEPLPMSIRLLPLTEPIPNQSLLNNLRGKFSLRQNGQPALKQIDYLGITPDWATPALIAPLPSFRTRHDTSADDGYAFRMLERKKLLETRHALARFGTTPSSPFIARLLTELEQREPGSRIQPHYFRVLAGGKVQIDARWKKPQGDMAFFIKLPLVPFAEARLRKQKEVLHYLHRHYLLRQLDPACLALSQPVQKIFPQVFLQGEFEKQTYFLESRVKGMPLNRLRVPNEVFPKICDTLFLFWQQVQTYCGELVNIEQSNFEQIFQQPLQRLSEWVQPPHEYQVILQRLADFFARQFLGQRILLSLVHGDFSTKNILAHPKNFELSGIIDWDIATHQSIPLLDVLHFFVRLDPGSFREAPPKIALRLIQPDPRALHWSYFQGAMTKFGYEEKMLPAAVVYYWMQRLQVYLDSPKNLDAQFMQRHFYEILDCFNEKLLKR